MKHLRTAVARMLRSAVPIARAACGLVALSMPAAAQGTWQRVETVLGDAPFSAVAIPSPDVVVAASPYMRIIRSSDGGITWSDRDPAMPMALDRGLYGVAFADASTGVAVGNSWAVTRTTDGGLTWTYVPISFSSSTNLRNPVFRGDVVSAVTTGMIRSTDRGEEWTLLPFQIEGDLDDVVAIDDATMFAVGPTGFSGAGTILKSTDTGRTWDYHYAPQGDFEYFNAIAMNGPNGAVVGRSGAIYNTTDGGATWSRAQHAELIYDLRDVAYADPLNAIAVGTRGTILRSTNGGRTWSPEASGVSVDLNGVAVRGSLAIIVGDSTTVLRNGTVASVAYDCRLSGEEPVLDVQPNPSRGDASVGYRLSERGQVRLSLVDMLGREVRLLADGPGEPGAYRVPIPAADLPAGRYGVRIAVGDRVEMRPLLLVR